MQFEVELLMSLSFEKSHLHFWPENHEVQLPSVWLNISCRSPLLELHCLHVSLNWLLHNNPFITEGGSAEGRTESRITSSFPVWLYKALCFLLHGQNSNFFGKEII